MLNVKKMLNSILRSRDWVVMKCPTGTTGDNTESKITGLTITSSGLNEYFDTSVADQVTIKKAGRFNVHVTFGLSATSNADKVKRLVLRKNNASVKACLGRVPSWTICEVSEPLWFNAGDVLTMYRRFEDGDSTLSEGRIFIEYLGGVVRNILSFVPERGWATC